MSKLPINLADTDFVKNLIHTTESGMYDSVSEDGEKVIVMLQQGEGMEIYFYQKNGWIRKDEYNHIGLKESELFEGRWDRE